ncbi:MAG: tetratricopeptide repeat protein, partial [Planctomycetota bacterium]
MNPLDRKISQKELLLFYQIYQKESTSFQLFPEAIRLIRTGEPCFNVLQRKFGFTPKDIERFQRAPCPPDEFRNFLIRLQQQSLITQDEIQNEPVIPPKKSTVPVLTGVITLLVCLSLWVFRENRSTSESDESDESHVITDPDPSEIKKSEDSKTTPENTTKPSVLAKNKETLLLTGLQAQEEGKPEEAKKAFQELLTQQPNHLKANFQMGKVFLAEKQYESAYTFFNRVIQSDDNAPEDLQSKAYACYILNHLEWGERFALQALPHLPKNRELLTVLGKIQWALGKEKESFELF